MRDLVAARNCCMARMLPGEAEVSELTGLPGRAKSVKLFERSNGLDTALYKNTCYNLNRDFALMMIHTDCISFFVDAIVSFHITFVPGLISL